MRRLSASFFLGVVALWFFLPLIATAQTENKIPEFNPLCWNKAQCQRIRAEALGRSVNELGSQDNPDLGWVQDQEECPGQEWGKCLPAGQSITTISFGGRSKFLHIGDFIQAMYKYAIGIAGILAAVMIIIAGFQWTTAGGNAESIQSAKHRIAGALIGLVIAYMSYAILNTLNPALVNLRLPNVWMVRPQALVPQFCAQVSSSTLFAYATNSDDQLTALPVSTSLNYDLTFSGKPKQPSNSPYLNAHWNENTFFCGNRFYVQNGGNTACFGDACGAGKVCTDMNYNGKKTTQKYTCFPGMLIGTIYGTTLTGMQLAVEGNNVELYAMCKDGKTHRVDYEDSEKSDTGEIRYAFDPNQAISTICGTENDVLGFYLGVEVHDELYGSGTLAQDDWYAVGQSSPNSHVCDTNISKLAFTALTKQEPQCKEVECTCSFLALKPIQKALSEQYKNNNTQAKAFVDHLITLDQLKRGYQCNIQLSSGEFPSADQTSLEKVIKNAAEGATVGLGSALVTFFTGGTSIGITGPAFVGAIAGLNVFSDPTACDASVQTGTK